MYIYILMNCYLGTSFCIFFHNI